MGYEALTKPVPLMCNLLCENRETQVLPGRNRFMQKVLANGKTWQLDCSPVGGLDCPQEF